MGPVDMTPMEAWWPVFPLGQPETAAPRGCDRESPGSWLPVVGGREQPYMWSYSAVNAGHRCARPQDPSL